MQLMGAFRCEGLGLGPDLEAQKTVSGFGFRVYRFRV